MERLTRRLVDSVDVHRNDRVRLVDRKVLGPAVDLTRAREDDLHARVVLPAGLENRELGTTVDLEIGERVGHRVEVTRLAGQIEEHVLTNDERTQAVRVADVRDVHRHTVLDPGDVRSISAVFRHEGVDEDDVRGRVDELAGKVRTEKAQPAGDQDALTAKVLRESGFHHLSPSSPAGTTSACRNTDRASTRPTRPRAGVSAPSSTTTRTPSRCAAPTVAA